MGIEIDNEVLTSPKEEKKIKTFGSGFVTEYELPIDMAHALFGRPISNENSVYGEVDCEEYNAELQEVRERYLSFVKSKLTFIDRILFILFLNSRLYAGNIYGQKLIEFLTNHFEKKKVKAIDYLELKYWEILRDKMKVFKSVMIDNPTNNDKRLPEGIVLADSINHPNTKTGYVYESVHEDISNYDLTPEVIDQRAKQYSKSIGCDPWKYYTHVMIYGRIYDLNEIMGEINIYMGDEDEEKDQEEVKND